MLDALRLVHDPRDLHSELTNPYVSRLVLLDSGQIPVLLG